MIKAICQWFRDVFGPLTEEEQVAMARDSVRGYGNSRVYADGEPVAYRHDNQGLHYPAESEKGRGLRLRNEVFMLQVEIASARARHQRVSHLRQRLSRTMGELLVAVS